MGSNIEWRTDLPTQKYFGERVLVTLYCKKNNEHWVEMSYINLVGNFKSNECENLCYPVVAWSPTPEPYMTNPL